MRVAAIDLGATSARVAVVDSDQPDVVDVVHRYPHQPVVYSDGTLRWNWEGLVDEVERGLSIALESGPLHSIGVDTWGVDYGLLDGAGALVAPPFSYRDARTDAWSATAARLGEQRLYEETGIQLMSINTIFQLAAHDRTEIDRAERLLMLPELLVHHLTGAVTAETTSAGTTGLVSLHTGTWDDELLEEIDIDPSLFAPIVRAGVRVGEWRDVPVCLVGGHDTASAVHARPGPKGQHRAFVSTGSWVIVGVERAAAMTRRVAQMANFSNERAVDGGFRFLKNLTGLWLLERCRDQWPEASLEDLVARAADARGGIVVNTDDQHLFATASVPKTIAQMAELDAEDRGGVVRCILDSIAAATAGVLSQIGMVTGVPVTEIDILGGGSQIPLLVELIGEASGMTCLVGSPESTALGNAKVQFAALA